MGDAVGDSDWLVHAKCHDDALVIISEESVKSIFGLS